MIKIKKIIMFLLLSLSVFALDIETFSPRTGRIIKEDSTVVNIANSIENKDQAGRQALNTVFGDAISATRVPSIALQFMYGIDTNLYTETTANGGSLDISNSLLTVSTSTATTGSAIIVTKQYVRYRPGHDTYCYFTAFFSEGKTDSYQRIGLFDDSNGFFLGYEDDQFSFTRRRAGVDYSQAIDLLDLNFVLDTEKGNVYRIDYGFLGFANIIIEVLSPNGGWEVLSEIKYPNTANVTHIANTYLPVTVEVANTGNDTDISMSTGSVSAGIIDGTSQEITDRYNLYDDGVSAITSGNTVLFQLKNKSTFYGIDNKIAFKVARFSISTDLNKVASFHFEKNATITNTPTYSAIDIDNSIIEVSTDATITVNSGTMVIVEPLAKTGLFKDSYSDLNITVYPDETLTCWIETTGAGDVTSSVSWKELF